ncbi:helix-turn-helix domain-containing protein [Saccharopolyspora shandongensis]|uniref:helix-turn-helix domain-containing protein n=1 Tax=Saccharopolyspora shandongensis TaxID=418495 RepID=UPI0033EB0B99
MRRHRRAAGLSQAQLAQELHLDQGNLSRYENDRQCPKPATVDALDALLCAGGELRALANATTPQPATRGIPAASAVHPSDETDAMELARRVAASDISTETPSKAGGETLCSSRPALRRESVRFPAAA